MNTYNITLPNGKKHKITSDSMPTEQQLNDVYKNLYPSDYESYMQTQMSNKVSAEDIKNVPNQVAPSTPLKAEIKGDLDKGGLGLLFLEGLTFNLSDEAISFVTAATESMLDDSDFSTVYDEHRALYQDRIAKVREANPALAMTAEVGGALVNPVNFMGKFSAGRAVLEGGIAGFGSGEGDIIDRAGSTVTGAAVGGAMHKGMEGAGWLFDKATKTKLENLQTESGQIPFTLARPLNPDDPSSAQNFYRSVAYPAFSGSKLRSDESRFLRGVEGEIKSSKSLVSDLTAESKRLHAEAQSELKKATDALDVELKNSKASIDLDSSTAKSATESVYREIKDDLKSGERLSSAARNVRELISADEITFRQMAYDKSMPAFLRTAVGRETLDKLNNAKTANEAMAILDNAWATHGFSSIKGMDYKLPTAEFSQSVIGKVKSDVVSDVDFDSTSIEKTVNTYLDKINGAVDSNGRVSGEVLAKVRADLGTLMQQRSGADMNSVQLGQLRVLSVVQEELDRLIVSQLPKDRLQAFQADKDAWKHNKVLRAVVTKRSGGGAEEGLFTPKDWADANKTINPRFARGGTAPLQKESIGYIKIHEASQEAADAYSRKLAKRIEQTQDYRVGKIRANAAAEKAKVEKEIMNQKNNLKNNPSLMQDIATNQTKLDQTNATLNETTEYFKEISSMRSTKNPTFYHMNAANNILAGAFEGLKGALGGAKDFVLGNAVGLALSSDLAIRVAAKQTGPQRAAQEISQMQIPNPLSATQFAESAADRSLREGMLGLGNVGVRAGLIGNDEELLQNQQ